ncbi:MAG TPA: T9SS type A sorting domain-containing protein [Bacteroidota bacterium]|mgnify:FL=1|nr:T9SS type A sorting domain-containing protein [Bacteroidota bacterium]
MKNFSRLRMLIIMSIVLFSLSTYSSKSATQNPSQTTNVNLGPCSGYVTTCVSKTPTPTEPSKITVWVHLHVDSGPLGSHDWQGNIWDGPLSLKLPDGTEIPLDSSLIFNNSDIITNVSYFPSFDSSTNFEEWSPTSYNINFSDSATQQLTGILEKTDTDSVPVYYIWKGGSLLDKISDTDLVEIIQAINYSDPSYQAMTVFPNPANENITISFNFYPQIDGYPSLVGNTLDYLKIYSLEGKVVYEESNIPSRENKKIDIKSLSSGIYIIEIAVTNVNLKWHTMFSIMR